MYGQQVQLLVQTLPVIFQEPCFALKGGTAINLFIRDLPRLSVDADLVYLPNEDRMEALEHIRQALARISDRLCETIAGLAIHRAFDDKADALRLVVGKGDVRKYVGKAGVPGQKQKQIRQALRTLAFILKYAWRA